MRILALIVLLFAVPVLPFLAFGERFEAALLAVGPQISRTGYALLSFVLLAGDVLLPVPSSIVSLTTGAALGVVAGTVVIAAGMTAGCVIGHALGRRGGMPAARVIAGESASERLAAWLQAWGSLALVLLRPVPVLAEASLLLAGAGGLSLGATLLATTPANVGIAAVYAYLGAQLRAEAPFGLLVAAAAGLSLLVFAVARLR